VPYRITLSRDAKKALARINKQDQARIAQAIDALAVDPQPPGTKALQEMEGLLRIRIGSYRVVYEIRGTPSTESDSAETAEASAVELPDTLNDDDTPADETQPDPAGESEPKAGDGSDESLPEVHIIRIGHRREVYRKRT
jgi:mRNA interferase RelE/StbE